MAKILQAVTFVLISLTANDVHEHEMEAARTELYDLRRDGCHEDPAPSGRGPRPESAAV
jgi:hypothetical protein